MQGRRGGSARAHGRVPPPGRCALQQPVLWGWRRWRRWWACGLRAPQQAANRAHSLHGATDSKDPALFLMYSVNIRLTGRKYFFFPSTRPRRGPRRGAGLVRWVRSTRGAARGGWPAGLLRRRRGGLNAGGWGGDVGLGWGGRRSHFMFDGSRGVPGLGASAPHASPFLSFSRRPVRSWLVKFFFQVNAASRPSAPVPSRPVRLPRLPAPSPREQAWPMSTLSPSLDSTASPMAPPSALSPSLDSPTALSPSLDSLCTPPQARRAPPLSLLSSRPPTNPTDDSALLSSVARQRLSSESDTEVSVADAGTVHRCKVDSANPAPPTALGAGSGDQPRSSGSWEPPHPAPSLSCLFARARGGGVPSQSLRGLAEEHHAACGSATAAHQPNPAKPQQRRRSASLEMRRLADFNLPPPSAEMRRLADHNQRRGRRESV